MVEKQQRKEATEQEQAVDAPDLPVWNTDDNNDDYFEALNATSSDGVGQLPTLSLTDGAADSGVTTQNREARLTADADAIQRAFGYTSNDEDVVFEILKNRSPEDRAAINEIWSRKYGTSSARSLEQLFENEFSGFQKETALSLLQYGEGDFTGRLRSTILEQDAYWGARSDGVCEKDIRQTIASLDSEQLEQAKADYQKRYGRDLVRDLIGIDSTLSEATKSSLRTYLNAGGRENLTAEDRAHLAVIATANGDLDMFKEAFRGSDQEARDLFKNKYGGEQRIAEAFGTDTTESRHAEDYARDGKLSLATQIIDNTSNWGDSESEIEAAIKGMSAEERQRYFDGKSLAAGQRVDGLSADERQVAREYYRTVNTALQQAAGKPFHPWSTAEAEMLRWEDMIRIEGGGLVTRLSNHRGEVYDDNANDVFQEIENMSPEDWERYAGDAEYREDVKAMLRNFLEFSDETRAIELLDKRLAGQDGKRSLLETIDDNWHLVDDKETNVYDAIQDMSQEERDRYAQDEGYRNEISQSLSSHLSGTALELAQDLLLQVEQDPSKAPEMGILEKLELEGSQWTGDEAKMALELRKAFQTDPSLQERLRHPVTSEEIAFAEKFERLAIQAVGSSDYAEYILPLVQGTLSFEKQMELNNGYFGDDEMAVYEGLAAASQGDWSRVLEDPEGTLPFLSEADRQIAVNIAQQQGEFRPEDKLRAYMLGAGTSEEDIKELLSNLTSEEKEHVKGEYARKYGGNLTEDLMSELGGSDERIATRDVRTDATTARGEWDESRDEYYEERDGIGSAAVDTVWNGSGYRADEANLEFLAQMQSGELSLEDTQKLSASLYEAVDALAQSRTAMAETGADALLAVAAVVCMALPGGQAISAQIIARFGSVLSRVPGLVGTITTVGETMGQGARVITSLSRLQQLSLAATAGGVGRVGVKGALVGDGYDLTDAPVDFLAGAADSVTNFITPGGIARLAGISLEAGERALTGAMRELGEGALELLAKDGAEVLEEGMDRMMREAIQSGEYNITREQIEQLARTGLQEGLDQQQVDLVVDSLERALKSATREEAQASLTQLTQNLAFNTAGGAAGGAAGAVVRIDPDATLEENLTMIAMSTGIAGFAGLGTSALTEGFGLLRRPGAIAGLGDDATDLADDAARAADIPDGTATEAAEAAFRAAPDLPSSTESFADLTDRIEPGPVETRISQQVRPEFVSDGTGPARPRSADELERLFAEEGITDFTDFQRLAMGAEVEERFVPFTVNGRYDLTILVAESQMDLHSQVRQHRLDLESADDAVRQQALLAERLHPELKNAVLPEDIVRELESLPDGGSAIKEVVISDRPSADDPWVTFATRHQASTPFVTAASADRSTGTINIFSSFNGSGMPFSEMVKHEWAHLIEDSVPAQRSLFDAASRLETVFAEQPWLSRPYAGFNQSENWAVHMGEVFLASDSSAFHSMIADVKDTASSFKFLTMADALEETLDSSSVDMIGADELRGRIAYIREQLGPSAQEQLLAIADNPAATADQVMDATQLLASMGDTSVATPQTPFVATTTPAVSGPLPAYPVSAEPFYKEFLRDPYAIVPAQQALNFLNNVKLDAIPADEIEGLLIKAFNSLKPGDYQPPERFLRELLSNADIKQNHSRLYDELAEVLLASAAKDRLGSTSRRLSTRLLASMDAEQLASLSDATVTAIADSKLLTEGRLELLTPSERAHLLGSLFLHESSDRALINLVGKLSPADLNLFTREQKDALTELLYRELKPGVFDAIELLAQDALPSPVSTRTVSALFENLSPEEIEVAMRALSERAPYMTPEALSLELKDLGVVLREQDLVRRELGTGEHYGRYIDRVTVAVSGQTSLGHELGFMLRKYTGIDVEFQVIDSIDDLQALKQSGKRAVLLDSQEALLDSLSHSSGLDRAEVQGLLDSATYADDLNERFESSLNFFDLQTADGSVPGSLEAAKAKIDDLIELHTGSRPTRQSTTATSSQDAIYERFLLSIGSRSDEYSPVNDRLLRGLLAFAQKSDWDESLAWAMAVGIEPKTYGEMMDSARYLMDELRDDIADGANIIFVSDLDPNGSNHIVNGLMRRANPDLRQEQFMSVEQIAGLKGKLPPGTKIVYVDDLIGTGSQIDSKNISSTFRRLQGILGKGNAEFVVASLFGTDTGRANAMKSLAERGVVGRVLFGTDPIGEVFSEQVKQNASEELTKLSKRQLAIAEELGIDSIADADELLADPTLSAEVIRLLAEYKDIPYMQAQMQNLIDELAAENSELAAKLNGAGFDASSGVVTGIAFPYSSPNNNAKVLRELLNEYLDIPGAHSEVRVDAEVAVGGP